MWTQALCGELEPRIPGTLLRSLWWCFVLLKALLGFTWVFALRQTGPGKVDNEGVEEGLRLRERRRRYGIPDRPVYRRNVFR